MGRNLASVVRHARFEDSKDGGTIVHMSASTVTSIELKRHLDQNYPGQYAVQVAQPAHCTSWLMTGNANKMLAEEGPI